MSAFEEETAQDSAPGRLILALFFLVFGAGGLALMPFQTRTTHGDEGWFTQPWLMPLLTLGMLTAVSLIYTVRLWQNRKNSFETSGSGAIVGELWMWLRSAEFFVWYVAYILALGVVGYSISTFVFIGVLGVRVGLRQPKWLIAALGATIGMTLLFRLGLEIWVPPADLYDVLPKGLGIFLQLYF